MAEQSLMHRNYLHRLLTPGGLSPKAALFASILVMVLVLILDLITPANIRLHVLYIFPLAVIALHCKRMSAILSALALSVVFQFATFSFHGIPSGPLMADAVIALASSVLTIALARATRESYLATVSLATTDWLTGLQNRRQFMSVVDVEIERQKRYGGIFSLAVIDLDNFKELNDTQGHGSGDMALKLVADVLQSNTRHTDSIARLGGDEFAILMPNTHKAECNSLCQLLTTKIAQQMTEANFGVTASIGYAACDQIPISTAHALQEADQAMYAAKAKGKNGTIGLRLVHGARRTQ